MPPRRIRGTSSEERVTEIPNNSGRLQANPTAHAFWSFIARWDGHVMCRKSLLNLGCDRKYVEHLLQERDAPSNQQMRWSIHEGEERYGRYFPQVYDMPR